MEEYMLKEFEEKLDEQIKKFLNQISYECREGFEYDRNKKRKFTSGFPIFELAEEKYYHSKQQEEILEWRVRDELVNKIFDYLFKIHGYDIRWKLRDYCETSLERNEEYEKEFPVEFFIVKDGRFLAYRYAAFTADYSIPDNLPNRFYLTYHQTGVNEIEKWYQIVWDESQSEQLVEKFQNQITVEKLFEEYFSKEEYELYIDKVKEAVASANMLMGFQTIQKLESNNLVLFKESVINEFPDIRKMKYWKITEMGSAISKEVNIYWEDKDIRKIQSNFETEQRNLALIGSEKFAQSFVTSEYLYRIFKGASVLDYTAVVCGYIKSIEQLCESIIFNVLPKMGLDLYYPACYLKQSEQTTLLRLKELKMDKPWRILMKEGNQKYFDKKLTMNQMFYFFEDNAGKIFDIESEITIMDMLQCMKNYCDFDRNGYLHKHNINESEVVERIRNNTLVISYWLLGGIRMTGNKKTDETALGIIDFSFDRLFKKIVHRYRRYKYIFDFGDGNMHKMVKTPQISQYYFDEKGVLQNAELTFIEVEEYPNNYFEFKEFLDEQIVLAGKVIVDRSHLPSNIWWVNEDGIKELIYRHK